MDLGTLIDLDEGEIAAAFAASFLQSSEAIAIAYYRGFAVSQLETQGAMMAVGIDYRSAQDELKSNNFNDAVSIACINSPNNVTLSGELDAIERLFLHFQQRGILAKILKTDGKAYHSRHMQLVKESYEKLVAEVLFSKSDYILPLETVVMASTTTGDYVSWEQTRSPTYWSANLESPVLFEDALERLYQAYQFQLVEIGPHPALKMFVLEIQQKAGVSHDSRPYTPSLVRGNNSVNSMLHLAGRMFLQCQDISIANVNSSFSGAMKIAQFIPDMPAYSWDYGPVLYHEPRMSLEYRNRKFPPHDLLGVLMPGGSKKTFLWRNVLRMADVPWLADHKLGSTSVFPAAAYLATIIEAFCQVLGKDRSQDLDLAFQEVKIMRALVIPQTEGVEIFTQLSPSTLSSSTSSQIWWQWEISSVRNQMSTDHATGRIALREGSIVQEMIFSEETMEAQPMDKWYNQMLKGGIDFGPAFQSMPCVYIDRRKSRHHALSKTAFRASTPNRSPYESSYPLHPITIDALLQTALVASSAGRLENLDGKVPVSIDSIELHTNFNSPASEHSLCNIRASAKTVGIKVTIFNMEFYDAVGHVALKLKDVRTLPYQEGITHITISERYPLLRVLWMPDISNLSTKNVTFFSKYIQERSYTQKSVLFPELANALDLLSHQNPNLDILALEDGEEEITSSLLPIVNATDSLRRCKSWTRGKVVDSQLIGQTSCPISPDSRSDNFQIIEHDVRFDLIIVNSVSPDDLVMLTI